MRVGAVLTLSEARPRYLALGEGEEGGPPVPLAVKRHIQQTDSVLIAGM